MIASTATTLARLLAWPGLTLLAALLLMALVYTGYARFNHGVEFFPGVEPDNAQVLVRSRGDFSAVEKDAVVRRVEARLAGMSEVEALYARSFARPNDQLGGDVIGVLQFQLIDWQDRRPAARILAEMARRTADLPGIELEFREQEMGPGGGKPVVLEISAQDPTLADQAVEALRRAMEELGGFRDIEDNRSLSGVEWRVIVDREASRSLDQLGRLTLNTPRGQVPISHFVELRPAPKVGTLHRIDGRRALTLEADVDAGVTPDERLAALSEHMASLPEGVFVNVAGEQADQQEATRFLITAFLVAICLKALILVTQFNSLYQAALEAGGLRLRPVLLTAITTVLGLMPMMLEINVNLFAPSLGFGAPSTQWWTQLSSAIAGGLTFATGLTLLLTPCMLVLGSRLEEGKRLAPSA